MNRKGKTQIIGIRIPATIKQRILEEAKKRDETMTLFLYRLIAAGWEVVVKQSKNESVKQ
jgi:hypothetical protein